MQDNNWTRHCEAASRQANVQDVFNIVAQGKPFINFFCTSINPFIELRRL